MLKSRFSFVCLVLTALLLAACSSAPAKKSASAALTSEDSLAIAAAVTALQNKNAQPEVKRPVNLDAAHEAFLRAEEAELRGDKALAQEYWKEAANFDPYNRYLGFKLAEQLMAEDHDSLALVQAKWSNALPGKVTSSQLGTLARLYVKEGLVDSCRKYFTAALDSSKNQDTGLLYDYSLFLEAIKDRDELIRVYDLLLPHVNYIPNLLQRQFSLLADAKKDSAIVDLLYKAHEVSGDKRQLASLVEMLVYQQRIAEANAIVDTLTDSTELDDDMIIALAQYYGSDKSDSAYALLQKKYETDGIHTPLVANFLGHYEHMMKNLDSAKVHLELGTKQVGGQKNYVAGAYQSLFSIAISENRVKDAVRYAEALDSVSGGTELGALVLVYAMDNQYDKAFKKLDSAMAFWDNWKPLEEVADSLSLAKMMKTAELKKLDTRFWYARILSGEAQDLDRRGTFDGTNAKRIESDLTRANQYYEYVMARLPDYQNVAFYYASNLERLKRYDESFALFEKMLMDGNLEGHELISALNYYGYSLIDLNRNADEVAKGLDLVTRALELDPENDAIMDSKAWGLYRQGKFNDAYAIMKQLKDPDFQKDVTYWEHLAAIQDALGLKADATKSYKALLKLRPNHPEALQFLKKKK